MDVLKRRRIREWTCQGVDLNDRSVDEVARARARARAPCSVLRAPCSVLVLVLVLGVSITSTISMSTSRFIEREQDSVAVF
jgi:hypothetical protein